jgi:hypothetical protein
LIWWIDLQSRLLKKLARHLQFLIIPLSRIYALIKGVASSNQAKLFNMSRTVLVRLILVILRMKPGCG